jgi:putative acetyltransferase
LKGITIRGQEWRETRRISRVIKRAFAGHPHSDGREAEIYEHMFSCLDADVSLVAAASFGRIVGHVLCTEVKIEGEYRQWAGLGPVSVLPRWQGRGIGSALIERALAALQQDDWHGCVVLGDPGFYGRFGFAHDPNLLYPGPPPEYFQRIVFSGAAPNGVVSYAPIFG